MSTVQGRRKLGQLNKSLRNQYTDLKIKKQSLSEHIQTILRRSKQMESLKKTLKDDLFRAQQSAKADRSKKIAYIGILEGEITMLNQEYSNQALTLQKYQDEYELCLQDYDNVLKGITKQLEGVKILESDIIQQKQSQASMKAIIFDYEKLKRVLEQQKNYLKQLSSSQEKSHEDRMKQLTKMKNKLIQEGKNSDGSFTLARQKAGLAKMNKLFNDKIKDYSEKFLRDQIIIKYKTELGIKIFRNCLQLGSLKHKISTRQLFYKWHHNVFSKTILTNLVQNAMDQNIQSKKKINIINVMSEKTNQNNLYLFHLFEKGKFISTLSQKIGRKDIQYGFNKWRQNYHKEAKQYTKLNTLFNKTLPSYEKRWTFQIWKQHSYMQGRIQRANHLLQKYFETRQLSRIFRKWRLQIPTLQMSCINYYIRNIKDRNIISSRIGYQKRKTKALDILSSRMTKIKIRNYFIKYWTNVKDLRVLKLRENIVDGKNTFSELRAENKMIVTSTNKQNRLKSLRIFRKFMCNLRIKPVFRKWRNTNKLLHTRSQAIYHISLKRQAKAKIYVMNQFRRCVQYYQKKQMHQILTDLNNKMEAINQKSTDFRNRHKKCVQQLGAMASKKIDYIMNYSEMCQKRVYFNNHFRKQIKRLYNQYLIYRMGIIVNNFYVKGSLNQIDLYAKNQYKQMKLKIAQEKFENYKNRMFYERIFYAMKGAVKNNKQCFKRMIKTQNVMLFYRVACGFLALQRKTAAQKVKSTQKTIAANQKVLQKKCEDVQNLEERRRKLENALQKIFIRFINFQNRNMELKQKQVQQRLIRRYFTKYRQNTANQIHCENTLLHFDGFLKQKNNFIFWKGATALKYQNLISLVKEDLGQINKKKKSFQQKNSKGRGDIQKRLGEATQVYNQKKQNYQYYFKKYQEILDYYARRHTKIQNRYYMKEIFGIWKRQYSGAKSIYQGINKVYQKNLVHPSLQQMIKIMKREDSQFKSQLLCADILFRKAKNCMKDCLIIWRCNLRQIQCDKMQREANQMIKERQILVGEGKTIAELISNEKVRERKQKCLAEYFMAFKNQLSSKIYLQKYQIGPLDERRNVNLLKKVISGWKWLMFYKKTKRSYLKHRKQKMDRQLKSDVFVTLKIYRQEHYKFVSKIDGVIQNISQSYLRFALDKIINVAAYQRDELQYERRRALRTLVMNKVSRVQLIKKKIMAKWHAWLIPKDHYLPVIMKSLQINALRKAFAHIREKAYWHPIYIKDVADKVTNEGYTEINNATNNLVKEGFDPDQIKDYLSEKNEQDNKIIKRVVSRMETWGQREDMVRAWNSWKQYLQIKRKIRKSMSKVMMIAQGLGRYWNRWKKKDPQFNNILQKQSRGNMLQRYRDLGRLLKQYRRDVKDSKVYCQQLKQINDNYSNENEQGIRMALSTFSNKLKIGLRQGMDIWRKRVREYHYVQTDRKYDDLSSGIEHLMSRRKMMRERIAILKQENTAMKQKCNLGAECGMILQNLLKQKDTLSIDLADKEHNLKLLLEDNIRLKQKIKAAKTNAEKLITNVKNMKQQQ